MHPKTVELQLAWDWLSSHSFVFAMDVQRMPCRSCTLSCITVWAAPFTARSCGTGLERLAKIVRRLRASGLEPESTSDDHFVILLVVWCKFLCFYARKQLLL